MCKGAEAGKSTVGPENPDIRHECKEFEVCLSVSLRLRCRQGADRGPLGLGGLGGCRKWMVEDGQGGGREDHIKAQGCRVGEGGRRFNVLISTSGNFVKMMAKNSKRHKHGRGDDLG